MTDAYTQAREGAVLFDLSGRGQIELAGKDARLFLHNLCTSDVKDLPVGGGCEAFLCTAKARVVAHVVAGYFHADDQDVLRLDVEPGMATAVLKHLDHYLISERVEFADRTSELAVLRVCGPNAGNVLREVTGDPIPDLLAWHHVARKVGSLTAPVHVRRQACLAIPGYDLIAARTDVGRLRDALTALGTLAADPETHEILRVEAGWPVYGVDMDDNRFVVEVGRTPQAISYTKGCYLGQEPIVMARDRGHVNRTLLGIKVATGEAIPRGARLFHGSDEVGQVTSSVTSPRLGAIALAYLKRGSQEPGTALTIEPATDGRQGVVASLPFSAT
jgi:tRNA-modifying protein YgfZ